MSNLCVMFNNFILHVIKGGHRFVPVSESRDWTARVLSDTGLGIAAILTDLDKLIVGKYIKFLSFTMLD